MGEPLSGQLQSQLMNLCAGNKNRGPAAGRLIRHFRLFQFVHNPRRIFGIEVREENLHVGLLRPEGDGDETGNRAGERNQNDHALIDGKLGQHR